ncbi:hypothetical protein GCM10022286_19760 [Gryllotalpicola daejeonensis]|uniref:NAD-dependent epimerase/dehydratase domain-containing protein n=1 Tax=Gryllotalpicola daejeonensis TaxID=993087 RepID=A0ABP7ZKM5_9MICO
MAQVLVTGGTGFIASWCIVALLDAGHDVRTTVRSLAREPRLRQTIHSGTEFDDTRLSVVRADLESDEGWADAVADLAPYQRSKTLAEQAAWRFIDEEGGEMELAAVHPAAVIGPVLGPDDPPSLRIITGMLEGQLPACPPFGTSWVDVRDVADLHVRAMTDPAAAGGRWLAATGRGMRIVEVARILREQLGDRAAKAPTHELPLPVARLLSRFNPGLRALRPQLGKNFYATGAKAERLLGWKPRPIEVTIAETAESLLAHGV